MKAKTSDWKVLAVVLGVVALAGTAGAAPVTWTEDFETGFTAGQPVGNHADWYAGPNINATAGVAGSVGWDNSGTPATWTAAYFDWGGAQFNSYTVGMDFETDGSGNFDDDRVGFSIYNPTTDSSNVMSVQMDPGGSGLNIEGYWDGVGGADKRPSIVDLTGLLAPDTWYRLKAVYTKTAIANEPIIAVDLQALDASGNPTGSVASATLDTATLPAGDRPHTKYFSGYAAPAYKNHSGAGGNADNALAIIDDDNPPPPPGYTGPGNWNVALGDWSVGANWLEGSPPTNGKAYVTNEGTCNLDYAAPDVTEFDVENNSTVNILPGASLTGTSGYWKVGDGNVAGKTSRVIQTGGTVQCASDLYLGDDDNDYGEWRISGGSLEIMDDLKLADDGGGLVVLSGTGNLTVHGYIAITNKTAPSAGTLEISGGTLTQVGDHGDADDARLTVADEAPGTLRIIGGLATINVSNFEQTANGTFEAIMNGTGISTINCVGIGGGGGGGMTLAGDLIVSFAAGDPPPLGPYDLIVADTLVGAFDNITAPPEALVTYETGSEIVRITVVPEPATMSLLGLGALALIRRRRKA